MFSVFVAVRTRWYVHVKLLVCNVRLYCLRGNKIPNAFSPIVSKKGANFNFLEYICKRSLL